MDIVNAVIYKWTNIINGMSYIGQTINERGRYREHIAPYHKKSYFHNAIDKYGVINFEYVVLFSVNCPREYAQEILDFAEIFYIDYYNTFNNGYNMTTGGGGTKNIFVSEETRRKLSESHKGKTTWNKGLHHSEQTKTKISLSLKGKPLKEETKKKLGDQKRGKSWYLGEDGHRHWIMN